MKKKVIIDLAALKAAASRDDSSMAMVARRWLGDVADALSGEADVVLLSADQAPTPMVTA